MPLEGLDEEGLPRNPDLRLVQLRFLLTVDDGQDVDREETWQQLLEAIKEKCEFVGVQHSTVHVNFPCKHVCVHTHTAMGPFYSSVCTELGRPIDADLLAQLEASNKTELEKMEEKIDDAEKNFGETEQRDALMAKAEYRCQIGDKVCFV